MLRYSKGSTKPNTAPATTGLQNEVFPSLVNANQNKLIGKPHTVNMDRESGFWPALTSSLQAITPEKVGLDWHESKHDADSDDEVEVG